jgi:WD40 repeat protein
MNSGRSTSLAHRLRVFVRSNTVWISVSGLLLVSACACVFASRPAIEPGGMVAFSPTGDRIAVLSWRRSSPRTGRLRILELPSLRARVNVRTTEPIHALSFSPDGRMLAIAGRNPLVTLLDAESGQVRRSLTGHTDPIDVLAFSPDGCWLASGDESGADVLWDVTTGRERARFQGGRDVMSLSFSYDSQLLACANRVSVSLFNVNTRAALFELCLSKAHGPAVFHPIGRVLATKIVDRNSNNLFPVVMHDIDADCDRLTLDAWNPSAMAFSPDGRFLVTGEDEDVIVRDVANQKELARLEGPRPDVVTERVQGFLSYHNLPGGVEVAYTVWSAAFSTDGRYVAYSSNDGTSRLWEWEGGRIRFLHRAAGRPTWVIGLIVLIALTGTVSFGPLCFASSRSNPRGLAAELNDLSCWILIHGEVRSSWAS